MPFITVPIDGGLDLVTPPVSVMPGRMQDCENFEVALNQGAKSIDGYERFDGGISPSSSARLWLAEVTANPADPLVYGRLGTGYFVSGTVNIDYTFQDSATINSIRGYVVYTSNNGDGSTGSVYFVTNSSSGSTILGYCIAGSNGYAFYQFGGHINFLMEVRVGGTLQTGDCYLDSAIGDALFPTVQGQQGAQAAYYALVRDTIQEVPGQGNVLGLFWLKDELYACRDYFTLAYSGAVPITANYNDELFIGASYAAATWKGFLAKKSVLDADNTTSTESGVMMFYNTTGTATLATLKNHTQGDVSVATVTTINAEAQAAGLYKADGARGTTVATQSWTHQELGYRVRYKDGQAEFVPANRVSPTTDIADLIQSTDWVVADKTKALNNWSAVGGSAFPDTADALATDDGDTSYFWEAFTAAPVSSNFFWNYDFGLTDVDIPDGSTITGFSIEIIRRFSATGTATGTIVDGQTKLTFPTDAGVGTAPSFGNTTLAWTNSYVTATYGGPQSLLGYTNVTTDAVKNVDFGISMATVCTSYTAGTGVFDSRITCMKVKVHFLPPQSQIYFWDGSTAVIAEVVMPYQTSGSVTAIPPTAKGHLFLMNVGTNRAVGADEEIRTMPPVGTTPAGSGDGSSLIAMTENSITKNVMDWGALLTGQGKQPIKAKYQYVVSNFYAAADFDAIYGVSGCGPAFMYDGFAFTRIYTGTPEQDDIPRHCAVHQSRLFLGYRSGSVQFSVAGNPLSFDPLQFAGEIGVGAAVRGLMELNGDTLAEITQKGVSMIQGDVGLGPYPGIISPDVGCVEYSAQSMGQFMYTSFRGIQNLRATQSYGDFDTSQFSWDVWSFLRPRVQTSAFFESANIGVINSLAVRNKSQYRLMFADGKQLTATFLREGEMPQYTIQQYYHANGTTPLTWDVVTAGMESNGRDRLFGATNDGTGYVYEIDRGYSFDGGNIAGYFVMAIDDQRSPAQDKAFPDMHIYGIATDYAAFTMSRGVNYQDPNPTYNYPQRFGSLTAVPTGEEAYGVSNTPVRNFGANISFRFDVNSNSQPPVTIQAISYYITPAGQKRT